MRAFQGARQELGYYKHCKARPGGARFRMGRSFRAGVSGGAGATGRDRHLGTDSGILEQHPCPDGGVAGHEAPVPTDLSGMQQCTCVQVGENAEQGSSHLEDLRADDLVGAGGAAPLCSPTPPTASLRAGCTIPEGQR